MNNTVRETLTKLIFQHGTDLCTNRQRLEGMLRDYCGQHKREVTVIVTAVREGVAEELLHVNGGEVDGLLVRRLILRLHEDAGIDLTFASWAVATWATALGKTLRETPPPPARQATEETAQQSPSAQPEQPNAASQRRINPTDGAQMLWIPEGDFLMGSYEHDGEKPPHKVYLDGYWIYKYEVTVGQYRKFCSATNRKMPGAPDWGWWDDHPVVKVSWNDAKAYCDWAGVQLPTEAQWEKAARGTDGRTFPWGYQWDVGNCAGSVVGRKTLSSTEPVGSYPQGASPYGCLDMAGNVLEWCADWYGDKYYSSSPSKNPTGPNSGTCRVLRGGSWRDGGYTGDSLRAARRSRSDPDSRFNRYGFRCLQGPL